MNFFFVSPKILQMPEKIKQALNHKAKIKEIEKLGQVIKDVDVIYMTRVQKERFADQARYERLKNSYVLTTDLMKKAKKNAIVMHPLPRVGEISEEIDSDPRALYLTEQMRNGLYIRMALLAAVLGKA